jgi:Cdc6-like AAA superfamily ATPase
MDTIDILHILTTFLEEERNNIHQWLNSTDPSSNFHALIKQRQAETGLWLLESREYVSWKTGNNSILWLYGKSGCGKSVLASTVVDNISQHCQVQHNEAVAYFYFSFTDNDKQKSQNMIRSVISQLFSQSKATQAVEALFSTCRDGQRQPTDEELMKALQSLSNGFDETYIILDALDECTDRQNLFSYLEAILDWNLDNLHILTTSRPGIDIEDALQPLLLQDQRVCIQSGIVHRDIRNYVQHRIRSDKGLARWRNKPDVQSHIEKTLMEKVDGM